MKKSNVKTKTVKSKTKGKKNTRNNKNGKSNKMSLAEKIQMKKESLPKKSILILIYIKVLLIEVILNVAMSFSVPILANYPPYTEAYEFQKALLGKYTHEMQYLLAGTMGFMLLFLALKYLTKKIGKFLDRYDKNQPIGEKLIKETRKSCSTLSFKYLVAKMILLIFALTLLFSIAESNGILRMKFFLIYISFFLGAWVISSVIIKENLNEIIALTFEVNSSYDMPKRKTKFYKALSANIIIMFTVIIVGSTLDSYASVVQKNGEGIYYYYKEQMTKLDLQNKTINEVKAELNKINKRAEKDYFLILTKDREYFSSKNGYVSDFFKKYVDIFFDKTHGRIYEYYGIEEEACLEKIVLKDGTEAYVGIKYITTEFEKLRNALINAIAYVIGVSIIIHVWSKNTSKNIELIDNEFQRIVEKAKKGERNEKTILPIYSHDELGELVNAYNQIHEITNENLQRIKNSQNILVEQERLASLGQMIGGIAHNLKSPILSIAGAVEGMKDLKDEMSESLDNDLVTLEDKRDILKEQQEWIDKIKLHLAYMSDVITAVKGQATVLVDEKLEVFTIEELLKNVKILTAHQFKNSLIDFEIQNNLNEKTQIKGSMNALIQIINNIISNAIESYNGQNGKVELIVNSDKKRKNIVISVRDKGQGMSKSVQKQLFKNMVTTKGKKGTGLGLYMSYSTIKGKFKGDLQFVSEEGKGTDFHIIVPEYKRNK